MKILAISDLPDRPETALLAGLRAAGHTITLLSRLSPGTTGLSGVSCIPHTIHSRLDWKTISLLRRVAHEFDIVHCFSARAVSNAVLGVRKNTARIVAYRGTVGHLSRIDPSSWLSFLNPRVAAISCVSHAVSRYLHAQGVPQSKLFTIYKGHDPAWYTSVASTPPNQIGGLPPGPGPIIVFVGNMRRVKGADILVDAFSRVNHPTAQLVLVGEVRDSAVRRAIERSQRAFQIHLLGKRNDVAKLTGASDMFVMPSREREGLPKAVIEAMMLSKPVILSDAGGMPEMIEHNKSGLLFRSGDVDQLALHIQTLIANPEMRREIGHAACARAQQQFRIADTIERTQQMYRYCLQNGEN